MLITLTHVILVQTPLEQFSHVFHRDAECRCYDGAARTQQETEINRKTSFVAFFCVCFGRVSRSIYMTKLKHCSVHFISTGNFISTNVAASEYGTWPRDDGVLSLSLVLIYAIRNPFVFHFPRDLWSFSENVFKGFRKTFNCLKYRRREANMLQQFDTTLVF